MNDTAQPGAQALTRQAALPALDFMRSDILADTGNWRQDGALIVDVGQPNKKNTLASNSRCW